jgi:hypothetical protein
MPQEDTARPLDGLFISVYYCKTTLSGKEDGNGKDSDLRRKRIYGG